MNISTFYKDSQKAETLIGILVNTVAERLNGIIDVIKLSLISFNSLRFLNKFFGICIYTKCEKINNCNTLIETLPKRIEIVNKVKELESIVKNICIKSSYLNTWYKLCYKKYFYKIYENHEDLYALIKSYEGEDGEFVDSEKLLTNM